MKDKADELGRDLQGYRNAEAEQKQKADAAAIKDSVATTVAAALAAAGLQTPSLATGSNLGGNAFGGGKGPPMPGAATGGQPNCPPQFPLQFLGTGQGHFGAMEQHGQLQLHPQAQLGLPAQPPPQAHCLQHVPGLQPGETPMQYDIRATQMALQLIAGSGLSGLSSLLFNGGVPPAKQADAKQGNARKDTPSKDTPAKKKVKTRSSSSQSSCSSASSAKKLSRRTALQRVATKRSRAAPLPVQKGRERKEKANDKHKEKARDDKVKSAKKNGRRSDRHRELSSEDGASSTPRSLSFSPPKYMGRGRGRSPDAGGRSPGARGRSPVARGRSPGAASRG
jgi:hypothetical protein